MLSPMVKLFVDSFMYGSISDMLFKEPRGCPNTPVYALGVAREWQGSEKRCSTWDERVRATSE